MFEISENLPSLPEELIIEILLRVKHVKAVGRFRCVSKTCRSLLSSPQFVKSHLNGPENIFFLDYDSAEAYVATFTAKSCVATKVKFPLRERKSFHRMAPVQGSCHGLVLLFFDQGLLLLNPITGEAAEIPPYGGGSSTYSYGQFSCGFGLGYDSCTDDYKVFSVQEDGVDIYSVKTRTWKTLRNPPRFYHNTFFPATRAFVGGRLNFMSRVRADGSFVLAAFNVATEEVESVPYPKGFRGLITIIDKFTVVGGCLAMVVASGGSYDVWLMKEYGVQDSWTKFTMDPPSRDMMPLCFLGEEEIVFNTATRFGACERYQSRFFRYNRRSGVWRDMDVDGAPRSILATARLSFRESLISPFY